MKKAPQNKSKAQKRKKYFNFFFGQNITMPLTVMIWAGATYLAVYVVLNLNMIEYADLATKVKFVLPKGTSKDSSIIFEREVYSLQPFDTIGGTKDEPSAVPSFGSGEGVSTMATKDIKGLAGNDVVIRDALMHQNPAFMVRTMLILVMVSIAGGACPVFMYYRRKLLEEYPYLWRHRRSALVFTVCVVLFIVLVSSCLTGYYGPIDLLANFDLLLKNPWLLKAVVVLTYLFIAPSFAVIYLVGQASSSLARSGYGLEQTDIQVKLYKFEALNQYIKAILQVHAVIVVFSALTSNALGVAIRASIKIEDFDVYPEVVPFVYGIFYSLFLCALYIPTYMYLKTCYQQFSKTLVLSGVIQDKEKLKETLSIVKMDGISLTENIKLALTLLSPLLSVWLPEAFNVFK